MIGILLLYLLIESIGIGEEHCAKHERRMPLRRCPVFGFGRARGNLHLPLPRLSKAYWISLRGGRGGAEGSFSIQGRLQTFTNTGDSGRKLDRKFCARCGSAVFVEAEGFPGMALIMGGTLDDTSWLKPTMALFCDSAQHYLALWNALPSVEKRRKVGDRDALLDQLWSAIEALPDPEPRPDPKRPFKQDVFRPPIWR